MKNTFTIDRSQEPGKAPVFLIGIDGGFMDYELKLEDLIDLKIVIDEAIEKEKSQD